MAPRSPADSASSDDVLGLDRVDEMLNDTTPVVKRPPMILVWKNIAIFSFLHIATIFAFFLLPSAMWQTLLWTLILYIFSGIGITAGAHRLWSHRSYKARLPLRMFLAMCDSLAFQNSIYEWTRDHRLHHKFSETDADPHNAKRGFFFSHIGWLMVRKHPDVKEKGKNIDVSDLLADPVVMYQHRYYKLTLLLFCFGMPTLVPYWFWGESLYLAFYVSAIMRYTLVLHATWLVNSAAHMWGNKPYDVRINPSQNSIVAFFSTGEGFHNYHHVFPHDYSTSEYGWKLNLTTMFIDLMYVCGQAYDLRTIPEEVINKRKQRTGDGTD